MMTKFITPIITKNKKNSPKITGAMTCGPAPATKSNKKNDVNMTTPKIMNKKNDMKARFLYPV